MKPTGLTVIVRDRSQYDTIKKMLGNDILYVDWAHQMAERETGIVIWADEDSTFSTGGVGLVEYQMQEGIRAIEFSDYFITT